MSTLIILSRAGDDRHEWNQDDLGSYEKVKRIFEQKLNAGWIAYKKVKGLSEQIKKFDPRASQVMMIPPVAGG